MKLLGFGGSEVLAIMAIEWPSAWISFCLFVAGCVTCV